MAAFTYDVEYTEKRSRLTTAFRIILAIPHLIVVGVWQYFVEILAIIQWFIILFTGKRNQGIWNLQWAWLGYASRVNGYTDLLYDPYPAFGTDPGPVPVMTAFTYEEQASRLTNGLRIIWIIPAALLALVIAIALSFVVLASWFVIVITGKHPRGMFDFVRQALRYVLRTQSYGFLMTDTYPNYSADGGAPVGVPPVPPASAPPPPPQAQPHPPTAPPGSPPPPPPG